MGRKYSRAGKHLYLCVAGLILAMSGCGALKEATDRQQAQHSILLSQKLLAQGDYEGSLRENQQVALLFAEQSPGDEAIFNMALIYTDERNPKKDYQVAIGLLKKLQTSYPKSPLVAQSRVWVGVLEEHERLAQTNERLTQTNDKLAEHNDKLSQANEKLVQANEKLVQANEKLNQVIKKSQQVDLEIELKKREKERRGE